MKSKLIVSNSSDYSTLKVIRWLCHFDINFVHLNDLSKRKFKHIVLKNDEVDFEFSLDGQTVNSKNLDSYWYRRDNLRFPFLYVNTIENQEDMIEEVNSLLVDESATLNIFIDTYFSNFNSINKFKDNSTNKLVNLFLAKKNKLKIPNSYILSNKADLEKLIETEKGLIVKNMNQGSVKGENTYFEGLVSEFIKDDLKNTPETFFPTLFQEKIEKKYEIRSFFIDNQFFSMAIFSQNDEQTKIDFRNYNIDKPNRESPFQLPLSIEKKIIQFMNDADLNSGSIDLIIDKKNEIYFLEVNPVGQFEQVSIPCNYYLDRLIAKKIINENARKVS